MSDTDSTLEQDTKPDAVLQAIAELSKKIDGINKRLDSHDVQFEAIRSGIVANSADFDRLQASVLNLRADVKELSEEFRRDKLALK